jgi:YidC/Oxa1 family membrane protein insertase
MKLYQEHKVNPLSSCLPLVAQMPVFIIMFRILYGLTYQPRGGTGALAQGIYAATGRFGEEVGFLPRYISHDSELFQSLVGQTEMVSLGLDLAKSPFAALGDDFATGLIYLGLVVVLGVLYFVQQRMVAARATVSPTMSPAQQKLMQYLPVVFAVFQVFFVLGLVIYYISQAILRIGLQHYITRAFYGHDEALGRQAQRASEHARELAKQDGDGGGGGLFAQARRDLGSAKGDRAAKTAAVATAATATAAATSAPRPSKRTTEPKNRPTPSGNRQSGRPQRGGRPGGPRSKSGGKRQR